MTAPDLDGYDDERDHSKCQVEGCRHALSMHNEQGYCRSMTTPDHQGPCICGDWRALGNRPAPSFAVPQ